LAAVGLLHFSAFRHRLAHQQQTRLSNIHASFLNEPLYFKTILFSRQFRRHIETHLDLSASYCRLNDILAQILLYNQTFIILPVVVYGCETWSLTLREERKLRVFENRVLRRLFGPKTDEVTREWKKKLHNKELNDLYCSPKTTVDQ